MRPFEVVPVFLNGAAELQNLKSQETFKVNCQRIKPYFEGVQVEEVVGSIDVRDP